MTDGAALHNPPSADDYVRSARRRARIFLVGGLAFALLVGGTFAAFAADYPFLPLALLVVLLTPVLLWRFPRLALYITLAAACLFELGIVTDPNGIPYPDSLTDRVPLFWNVNTIFQVYAHTDFKGIPLNLFEVFILIAGACSVVRAVYTRTTNLRGGPLLLPIGVYTGFVLLGWMNGVLTGGDFKISLQEVRSQLYFGLAYLMAVNIVRTRRDLRAVIGITVGCIGVKALLLSFRRFVTLHGQPLPDQGVGVHEEAFFFDAFALLLLTLVLCKALPRLRRWMWVLLPFVEIANLALNRRAATAAMLIVVPILLAAAYQALPERRRGILTFAVCLTVGFSIYYPLFKNTSGTLGQPARAIQSNFAPDARDASSNAARDAENANLMATIKTFPVQGYGYGRPYFHVVQMADISTIYALEDYIPHNQILWVWERVGSFGFLAFWMMIAAILIFAGQTLRAPDADSLTRAVAIFALLTTVLLVVFGLLDLQLSNFRDVLFAGIWAGVLAVLPGLPDAAALPSPAKLPAGRAGR